MCGDHKVFRIYDQRERQHLTVSWNDVRTLIDRACLVRSGEGLSRLALDALPKINLYSLVAEEEAQTARILIHASPPLCDREFCRALLSGCPTLSTLSKRGPLLSELARSTRTSDGYTNGELHAIRYLLHGNVEVFKDITTELVVLTNAGGQRHLGPITPSTSCNNR